jgi:hypothetical protein
MNQLLFEVQPTLPEKTEAPLTLEAAEKEYNRIKGIKDMQPVVLIKCLKLSGFKVWSNCSRKSLEKYKLSFQIIHST